MKQFASPPFHLIANLGLRKDISIMLNMIILIAEIKGLWVLTRVYDDQTIAKRCASFSHYVREVP